MSGNVKLNFVSNPIAAPRLYLVNLTINGQELDRQFCSGHGSTIEFFSMCTATSSPAHCDSIDVFPLTKSLIHGIFPFSHQRGTLWILSIAGFECALFTVKINDESGNKHSSLSRLKHWRFNDWIINAKPLADNKSFILHSATNCIKLLRFSSDETLNGTWGADCTELNVQLDCHAQVTASYIQGNEWDSLRVFAGTNFGAINLFKPANGCRVLGTYNGNTGMPFAIRSSSNWLFSVGDDRSLRIWDHRSRQQLFEKFGHGARAFVLEICESRKLLISAGLDSYLCVWRWTAKIELTNDEIMENLILERKVDLGCGALGAVRSISIMDANLKNGNKTIDVLIGSERGALISLSLPLHSRAASNLILFKMNAFVFIKLYRQNFLLFLDDQRNLVLRRMDSKNDAKLDLKLVEMGAINRQIQSISDSHGNPKKFRPDLFIYSHHAQTLALCSELDLSLHLLIFRISPDNSPYFKCIIIEGPFEQIHWIQPEDSRMLLTVNARGDMIIYQINEDDYNPILTEFVQIMQPNNETFHEKWPPRIQCNFLIRSESSTFESGILLLGTRSGSLLAYSMQSGNCISVYGNVHGSLDKNYKFARCGVTAILFFENPREMKMKSNLLSMGRDGSLKRWNFRRMENESFCLQLVDIHHLPMEWPCAFCFANDSRLLISGFHSNEFLLMNAKNDTILCNFQCGGGNRSWQLIMDDNGQKFKFVFTQKSLLNYVTLSPVKIHHIRSSFHSDGIVTLAAIVFGSNTTNTDTVIVTGGLDRRLTLLMTAKTEDLNPTDIFPVDSAQIHCSSIEGICVVDIEKWATFDDVGICPDDKVILSVGGRSEICVWRLHFCAEGGHTPKLYFLSSHQLVSGSSSTITDDTRLMSVRHLVANLVAILCSDGSIRITRFPPPFLPNPSLHSPLPYWSIRIPSLAMFRSMEIVHDSDFYLLFSISSSGHLHSFHLFLDQILDDEVPLPNYSSSSFFREQFPPVMVEQCGLSSLAVTKYCGLENSHSIFVGSESGRITVLKHKGKSPVALNTSLANDDVQHIELCTNGDWHSSTVTALQCFIIGLSPSHSYIIVFSISLDCRLTIGAFNCQQNLVHNVFGASYKLIPFRQFPLGISDPAALLLIPSSSINDHRHNFQLFVSGAGIEQIRLEIENAV